jgi:hypothetical protein
MINNEWIKTILGLTFIFGTLIGYLYVIMWVIRYAYRFITG